MDRKVLIEFAMFCRENYDLMIDNHIIEDYIRTNDKNNDAGESETGVKSQKCGFTNVVCSHITFDSVKCGECPH